MKIDLTEWRQLSGLEGEACGLDEIRSPSLTRAWKSLDVDRYDREARSRLMRGYKRRNETDLEFRIDHVLRRLSRGFSGMLPQHKKYVQEISRMSWRTQPEEIRKIILGLLIKIEDLEAYYAQEKTPWSERKPYSPSSDR